MRLALALIAAALVALAVPSAGLAASPSAYAAEVIDCFNAERQKKKRAPLQKSTPLQRAAQLHTNNMARQKFVGHIGKDGSDPASRVRRFTRAFGAIAENVAFGPPDPAAVCKGWMKSRGHRANILGSYTHVGVGYRRGGRRPYWTAVFGAK